MRAYLVIGLAASLIASAAQAITVGGTFNVTAVNVTNVNSTESQATVANYNDALDGTLDASRTQDTFTYTGLLDFRVGGPQRADPYTISTWLGTGTGSVSGLNSVLGDKQLSFPNIGNGTATTTFFMFSLVNKMDAADFTVVHDDGMAIFEGAPSPVTRLGGTLGPTSQTTTSVDGYTGAGQFNLLYVATNGNPSILEVDAAFGPGGGIAPVPLPAAAWMLLAGIGGLVLVRRRKTV